MGKNLLFNGIDIFEKIAGAVTSFLNSDYYNFGVQLGQAMDEVFLKAPYPKKQTDLNAYEFFQGFYHGLDTDSQLENQQLYNNIDGLGIMIYGPIQESMQEFTEQGNLNDESLMVLHEVSHTLLEGSTSMVAKGAITEENRQDLTRYGECLSSLNPKAEDEELQALLYKAYVYFNAQQIEQVGSTFGQIAILKCPRTVKFLSFWKSYLK